MLPTYEPRRDLLITVLDSKIDVVSRGYQTNVVSVFGDVMFSVLLLNRIHLERFDPLVNISNGINPAS